jgi:amino acid transporter
VQYLYGLGKQRVLWANFARTNAFDAPSVASLTQTVLAFATILTVAAAGWDPVTEMFYRLGNAGGFGVFLLLAATAVAVARYFLRTPHQESIAARLVAPTIAAAALLAMVYLVATHYATILNVPPGTPEAWQWPASFAVIATLGLLRGWYLKAQRPDIYDAMVHHQPTGLTSSELQPEGAF